MQPPVGAGKAGGRCAGASAGCVVQPACCWHRALQLRCTSAEPCCDHFMQLCRLTTLSSRPMSLLLPIPLVPTTAVLLPGMSHCVLGARPHQHGAYHVPRTAAGTAGQSVAAVGQGPPLRRPPLVRPPACLAFPCPLGGAQTGGAVGRPCCCLQRECCVIARPWHCIMERERGAAPADCGHSQLTIVWTVCAVCAPTMRVTLALQGGPR